MSTKKALVCRILTAIFTVLIWLVGAAILGFSIYLRVDYWINQYVGASDELTKYTITVYIFIATGAVIVLFGFVGLYGAIRPDKCALVVYLVFLPIVLCAIVAGGVYAYIYREEIENTVKNSDLLREVVVKKYGIDARVTNAFDFMQRELHCCGGSKFTDYLESAWSQYGTQAQQDMKKDKAPLTCCKDSKQYEDIKAGPYQYCSIYLLDSDQVAGDQVKNFNQNIYQMGCGEAFVLFFQDNIVIAAAIAFSIVGLLLAAIICVSLTLFFLRRRTDPHVDDVVYEMARTQEKSPYPARGGPYANLYQS